MHLVVQDLTCRRAGRLVLAELSFTLESGEALLVTGRNGVGKSTLLSALAGLLRPFGGSIALSGVGDRERPEAVHLLAHRDALKGALTPAETLRLAAALLGGGTDRAGRDVGEALAAVGLSRAADLPNAFLSAGQRRRLGLARLLVAERPLWLLDEPTTALDADGQAILGRLVAVHRSRGGAVIAATHGPVPIPDARTLALAPAATPTTAATLAGIEW